MRIKETNSLGPTLLVDPQEASRELPPTPEWLSDLEDHPKPSVPKETSLQEIR